MQEELSGFSHAAAEAAAHKDDQPTEEMPVVVEPYTKDERTAERKAPGTVPMTDVTVDLLQSDK